MLGAIAVMAIAATMAPAEAENKDGTVLLPTLGNAVAARCTPDQPGVFGEIIDVTAGATFTLTATDDGAELQDLDITFYKNMTPCEEDADAVAEEGDHENVAGDEAGAVPEDAAVAIVHLWAGANASFSYTESA
jgi:hypothetical protein